jgi:Metallo-peptidase family M12B Reprolysin-like
MQTRSSDQYDRGIARRLFLLVLTLLLAVPAAASAASPWKALGGKVDGANPSIAPRAYKAFALDRVALGSQLDKAPREGTRAARNSVATVAIPAPDGTIEHFLAQDSPIMEPGLAAKYPNIRTFSVRGVEDRTATGRIDLTPLGFHAVVRSAKGTWYVDPRFRNADRVHVSYFGRDLPVSGGGVRGERSAPLRKAQQPKARKKAARATTDIPLRTYRLALLSNPDYATYFGGTDLAVLAAKVTLMNRVNQIYNDDFSVRMLLIDGTDDELNFDTDAEMTGANGPCGTSPCYPDTLPNLGDIFGPASQFCGVGTLISNDVTLSQVVGGENFDIGHIALGNDGGGIAQVGAVGNIFKAEGCTGLPTPDGDLYAVDYVAHEMGHQFGGNHTFQGTTNPFDNNNCWGDPDDGGNANRNTATSVEPGSGSSIMAYAGICRTDDLQRHSDPYFSQRSIDEEDAYTTGALTVDEQQLVALRSFDANGDSFTLTYNGVESVPIVRGTNYSAAGIKTAVDAILPAGADVTIYPFFQDFFGDPIPEPDDLGFVIDFSSGTLAGTNVAPITLTGLTGGVGGKASEETTGGDGTNDGSPVATTDDAPVVVAPPDATIPVRTPFTLTGTATDPQGDPLTYLWEQNDIGTANPINLINNAKIDGPLFRVFGTAAQVTPEGTLLYYSPGENVATAADATRTFPDLAQVIAGNTNAATGSCPAFAVTPAMVAADIDPVLRDCYSEFLPTADYAPGELNFRLTARDRRGTGGGVGQDDTKLTLAPDSGPFRVTDTQTGADPGGPLAVTWDVAGTNAPPVGTTAVKISLSYDGGVTFPAVLANSTPNDGAETVTVPATGSTSTGRIKVEAIGNVFFDVSHADLTVQPGAGPQPAPTPIPPATQPPAPTPNAQMSLLRPSLSSVAGRLRVSRKGTVSLRLRCAAVSDGTVQPACRGSVRLRMWLDKSTRTIGAKSFTFPSNVTRRVEIKLSKRALRTLQRRRLRVAIRALVVNPGRSARHTSKTVTIRKRS